MTTSRKPQPHDPLIPEAYRDLIGYVQRQSASDGREARTLRRFRRRGVVTVGVVAALATGTALAATAPWRPQVGNNRIGHPRVSTDPLPADLVNALSVLRRPQNDADRDPAVQALLTLLGPRENAGIHVDGVRLLQTRADGVTVLMPADRIGTSDPGEFSSERHNVVCMLYGIPGHIVRGRMTSPSAGSKCGDTADLNAGRILLGGQYAGRLELNGLVPDGVAEVAVRLRDGATVRATVANNSFHIDTAAADGTYEDAPITWLDENGHELVNSS
jgi:hypothetical protein